MTYITKLQTSRFLTLVNNKRSPQHSFFMLLTFFICYIFFIPPASAQNTLNKIVIDAGHGGKDPGASGKLSREKDVVLAIALKTGQLIKEKYPDVEIIYTRKTDVFIPLKERAEIANREKADLFISIHCNSNQSSQPQGTETYVMGLHKSEANLNVAKTENAAILFEDDYQTQYDGFDPTSEESHIIFNFFQNSFLSQNLDIATKLQSQFTSITKLKDRGVKQAGFWVLYKTTMPGVLIETGFLSNSNDEKFLNSKEGQLKLSQAITKAVGEYKEAHDAIEKNKMSHKQVENPVVKEQDSKPEIKEEIKIEVEKTPEPKVEIKETEIVSEENNSERENTKTLIEKPVYKVQFLSLSTQKTLSGGKYDALPKIDSYLFKGMYRYTTGETDDYNEAVKLQNKVRKAGFVDAFIIAFYKGERLNANDARKISEK